MTELINKVMTAKEAVEKYVSDGDIVGIGGQSIGRCSMALSHEIIRLNKTDLTLVGCNMAMHMDLMVGAGAVKKTESGTGNLERYGTAFQWRKAIEQKSIEVEDYSHLSMSLRFLAGSLGLPFIPTKSMLGTDLAQQVTNNILKTKDPWDSNKSVLLLKACNPDVSIVHVQKADSLGNAIIEGFSTHEPEMIKASKSVIVSCEKLIDTEIIRQNPEMTSIPYIFVDAVVLQPWGAYPTSTYKFYEHDEPHIKHYQSIAKSNESEYKKYLEEYIYGCPDFDNYLGKVTTPENLNSLAESMHSVS